MKNLLLFSSLVILLIASPLCPGPSSSDLLQTGVVELYKQTYDASNYCYSVPINYQVPRQGYQLALSFDELNFQGSSNQFYVLKGKKQEKSFDIIMINSDKVWEKISISYLVSSRSDLSIGSITVDPFEKYSCGDQIADQIYTSVISNLQPTKKYQGNLFISGLQVLDSAFSLSASLESVNSTMGSLSIRINTNANPLITFIQFSYILHTPDFLFMSQVSSDPISQGDYQFRGISGINSGFNFGSLVFKSSKLYCQGINCKNECTTTIDCQLSNGLIQDRTCYACAADEKVVDKKCSPICSPNEQFQNGKCLKPACPVNSYWNSTSLQCICSKAQQHVINGLCQACPALQKWDSLKRACECQQNRYRINGKCVTCGLNQRFNENQQKCQCNYGLYLNQNGICSSCHPSCGRCTGPKQSQCTQCSDVSYTFINGFCKRNDPCPKGLFLNKQQCIPCSSYCQKCGSQVICDECIEGFSITELNYGGIRASYCVEKCGDGKRFELDCDDGNNINGDGCNSKCEVENGWTCLGGSTIKASSCTQIRPNKTQIALTGTVHLLGRIVQGVRLSYLPPQLTVKDCAECSKLLWVRVISSVIVPGIRVNYMPKSKYQFLVEFEFNGLYAVPIFTISVQINPQYSRFFTRADLAQLQIKQIDPSTLKINYLEQTLSLDEPQQGAIQGADQLSAQIFP